MASSAGINASKARLETVAGRSVLLLSRFDRDGARRIPFLSAMSLLGASDNESHSYLEIADALRQCSAAPREIDRMESAFEHADLRRAINHE